MERISNMRDFSSFSHKSALSPPACVKPAVIYSPNESRLPYYFDHYTHSPWQLQVCYLSRYFQQGACIQGKVVRGAVERLEEGKGRFSHCSLFSRQVNGGQKANIFPFAVSVKHTSHYSLRYSNLDFKKKKTSKFSEKVLTISSTFFCSFLEKINVFLIHTHCITALW